MKNLFKITGLIALITVIGFTMTACPDEAKKVEEDILWEVNSTRGSITITGFTPEYYGYYVIAFATTTTGSELIAANNVKNGVITTGIISSIGTLTFKVWEWEEDIDADDNDIIIFTDYYKPGYVDGATVFDLYLLNKSSISIDDDILTVISDIKAEIDNLSIEVINSLSIDFDTGIGTGTLP